MVNNYGYCTNCNCIIDMFGLGFIKLQELMIYMHGSLFTLAGYTSCMMSIRVTIYRVIKRFKNMANLMEQ